MKLAKYHIHFPNAILVLSVLLYQDVYYSYVTNTIPLPTPTYGVGVGVGVGVGEGVGEGVGVGDGVGDEVGGG